MAYTGTKLSSASSGSRIINISAWRKDAYREVAKTEMGSYAGFLHGPYVTLDCELSCAAIAMNVPNPTGYLQTETDQIRTSVLASLGLNEEGIILPENASHLSNLNRSLMNFISEYKKIARRLSSFLISTVDDTTAEVMSGLSDYAELVEHPIYIYNALLIFVKVSPETRFYEVMEIQTELNSIKPKPDDSIVSYTGRYKKSLSLYLSLGGRDLITDRANNFILSLTTHPLWREVIQREHARDQRWYVTWAHNLQFTNEAAFHAFTMGVQNKILASLQFQDLMDRHSGVKQAPERIPEKAHKALAATKESSNDDNKNSGDSLIPCFWCQTLNKRTAFKHDISNCFGVQTLTKALNRKDATPFQKIVSIISSGGMPTFARSGEISDMDEVTARVPPEKVGGGRPYPRTVTRRPVEPKTALLAAAGTSHNLFSALLDSDSDDSHSAFPAIDYDKLKYNLSAVGITAVRLIIDSGCTNHLFGDSSMLWDVREIPPTTFKGMANVSITLMGQSVFGLTYLLPGMGFNLISWSQLKRDKEILDTVRSFSDDEDVFYVSLRGNVPLVFSLDPILDLYVLEASDVNFASQNEKVKAAFPAKHIGMSTNAATHNDTEVVQAGVVETPESDTQTLVATTPDDSHSPAIAGLGVSMPLTPHARKRAEEARRLHRAFGHPSDYALRLLVSTIMVNSACSASDIITAHKLFGECIDCAKGKQTLITTGGVYYLATEVGQVIHVDIIYGRNGKDVVTKRPTMASWLFAVDELTGYLLLVEVLTKTTEKLLEGLQRVASYFQRYGHVVRKIMVDSESALKSCTTSLGLKGIELLPRPPGEHEKHAESHTRTLRARMRAIESHLGYDLPDVLSTYLALSACFSYNLVPNNRSTLGSPHTYVTGTNVDAHLYAKFVFGQTVLIPPKEAHTATNRDEPRATEAMFLGHLYGQPGSAYFLLFPATSKANVQVRAVESARAMVPTTAHMESIRALRPIGTVVPMAVDDELHRVMTAKDFGDYVLQCRSHKPHKGGEVRLRFDNPLVQRTPEVMHVPHTPAAIVPMDTTNSLAAPLPNVEETSEAPGTPEPDVRVTQEEPSVTMGETPPGRRSSRTTKGVRSIPFHSAYSANSEGTDVSLFDMSHTAFIASLSEELAKYGQPGLQAVSKEAQQLIDLNVIEPTDLAQTMHTLNRADRSQLGVLDTKCFIEVKRDGRHKARIVAGTGSTKQYRDQYGPVDSVTVRTETVIILLKVAAQRGLQLAVLDVPGAYLHAAMKDLRKGHEPDTPRYVRISGMLAEVMVRLKPEWKRYMNDKGELIMELKKALYGLIESSKLWNDEIGQTLVANGFVQSDMDPCLYVHAEKNLIVVIYVDDFLAAHNGSEHLQWLIDLLAEKYGAPRVQIGNTIDYLNIRIRRLTEPLGNLPVGSYVIDQADYAKSMMEKYHVTTTCELPHSDDFFDVDTESVKLDATKSSLYVSMCMSLLFTCNRVRVDVFLHTSFLCTRLKEPTAQDMTKLLQVFQYVNGTMEYGMGFSSGDANLNVFAWIDASYAVHSDAKGHSGTIVTVGSTSDVAGNVVYVKSRKQKLVGRSSTESELIALHDGLPQVVWTRNLLEELGYPQAPAEVFQDNKSTIFMSEAGRGNHNRSKHISVRYFYAKGLVKDRVVKLTQRGTDEMVADAFTKVMSRKQFMKMRDTLLINLGDLGSQTI